MGPNSTYYVLGSLDEARSYFDRLPSDRKQNYELHLALDVVEQMVRTISAGVCTADQVNQ
jgi:phage protein U